MPTGNERILVRALTELARENQDYARYAIMFIVARKNGRQLSFTDEQAPDHWMKHDGGALTGGDVSVEVSTMRSFIDRIQGIVPAAPLPKRTRSKAPTLASLQEGVVAKKQAPSL